MKPRNVIPTACLASLKGPCMANTSPILLFYLLGNPIPSKKRKLPSPRRNVLAKHVGCLCCTNIIKLLVTNNLCALKHENEKPAFRAPINLFSVWVFNPITWKIGWGKKRNERKPRVVIEHQDEMLSLGEKGGRRNWNSCIVLWGKHQEKVIPNQSKRVL